MGPVKVGLKARQESCVGAVEPAPLQSPLQVLLFFQTMAFTFYALAAALATASDTDHV